MQEDLVFVSEEIKMPNNKKFSQKFSHQQTKMMTVKKNTKTQATTVDRNQSNVCVMPIIMPKGCHVFVNPIIATQGSDVWDMMQILSPIAKGLMQFFEDIFEIKIPAIALRGKPVLYFMQKNFASMSHLEFDQPLQNLRFGVSRKLIKFQDFKKQYDKKFKLKKINEIIDQFKLIHMAKGTKTVSFFGNCIQFTPIRTNNDPNNFSFTLNVELNKVIYNVELFRMKSDLNSINFEANNISIRYEMSPSDLFGTLVFENYSQLSSLMDLIYKRPQNCDKLLNIINNTWPSYNNEKLWSENIRHLSIVMEDLINSIELGFNIKGASIIDDKYENDDHECYICTEIPMYPDDSDDSDSINSYKLKALLFDLNCEENIKHSICASCLFYSYAKFTRFGIDKSEDYRHAFDKCGLCRKLILLSANGFDELCWNELFITLKELSCVTYEYTEVSKINSPDCITNSEKDTNYVMHLYNKTVEIEKNTMVNDCTITQQTLYESSDSEISSDY